MPPPDTNITLGSGAMQSWASFRISIDGVEVPGLRDLNYEPSPTEIVEARVRDILSNFIGNPMTRGGLEEMCAYLGHALGIRVYPHTLDQGGIVFLQVGADRSVGSIIERVLQEMMPASVRVDVEGDAFETVNDERGFRAEPTPRLEEIAERIGGRFTLRIGDPADWDAFRETLPPLDETRYQAIPHLGSANLTPSPKPKVRVRSYWERLAG